MEKIKWESRVGVGQLVRFRGGFLIPSRTRTKSINNVQTLEFVKKSRSSSSA